MADSLVEDSLVVVVKYTWRHVIFYEVRAPLFLPSIDPSNLYEPHALTMIMKIIDDNDPEDP